MKNIIKYVSVAILSVIVYEYCIQKNEKQYQEKVYVAKNTERIFAYIYLMKNNDALLKGYTIGMLQDYIIWLSEKKRKMKYYTNICSILKDNELKNGLLNEKNKKLESSFSKVMILCNELKGGRGVSRYLNEQK